MLPAELSEALASLLSQHDTSNLAQQGQALSLRYRQSPRHGGSLVGEGALAYAAARMPATFEAVDYALSFLDTLQPISMIDAGAGPGTASWAAASRWDTLTDICQWERDPGMITLGKSLQTPGHYESRDLSEPFSASADLVVMAYALNEFPEDMVFPLVDQLWASAKMALVLIDPGTPAAWKRMMNVRRHLLAQGAHLAAPCSHEGECALPEGDWCHFLRRVPRTRLHREVKGGERSFEDEKFTCLVFTRTALPRACRVLRRPEYQKNLVRLSLCSPAGIEIRNVTKSQKEQYKKARDIVWGDAWE